MKVSLIISTYNKPAYLKQVLESILKLNDYPDEVIIADDGSTNDTTHLIEKYHSVFPVPLIHVWQEDLGFRLSRSRNNGLIRSSGDYLIFIDDDLILHPKFIQDHRKYAKKGCFYCGSRVRLGKIKTVAIMNYHRNIISFWETDIMSRLNAIRIPFLHTLIKGPEYTYKRLRGCHMALWKEDLIKINGFDERYTSWGREDSDIAMRMMHAGVKRINLKWAAVCYHLYHKMEQPSATNDPLLFEVIANKSITSVIGINQH